MLAIELPDDIERRLDALANATGRGKEFYLQEAIAAIWRICISRKSDWPKFVLGGPVPPD